MQTVLKRGRGAIPGPFHALAARAAASVLVLGVLVAPERAMRTPTA
jgi:hypothetical protein